LRFLDGVPLGLVLVIDVAAELDVVEGKVGVEEVGTEGGDELFKLFGEGGNGFRIGV
jgi:hypothetical protein